MSQTMQRHLRNLGRLRPVTWWAEGVLAAALGVAALAMLVLMLWISSPHAHGGPDDALRVAAGLWLLAHGVELVRPETLSGGAAPLGLTPLLLTALPAVLLYRCVRALEGPGPRIVAWTGAGYLLVAALATWYTQGGPFRAQPWSAAVCVPLLTLLCVGAGVWAGRGWPGPPSGLLPGWLPWQRLFTALRAAVLASAALVVGGAVLAAVPLVLQWSAATEAGAQLAGSWSGRTAVALLCLLLAPNAAVWGTAYALGPGFTAGVGHGVAPLATAAPAQLPNFPLLAALPGQNAGVTWALLGVGAIPLVAGVVAGLSVGRGSSPVRGSRHGADGALGTAGAVLLVGVGCGLGVAALAALAGGPLGTGLLADFGPTWWAVGAAALGWVCLGALPTAYAVRWWRIREPHPLLALALARRRALAALAGLVPRRVPRTDGLAVNGAWESGSTHGGPDATDATAAAGTAGARRPGSAGPDGDAGPDGSAGAGGDAGADGADAGDSTIPWWRRLGRTRRKASGEWHETRSRRTRWAALKDGSGGLMPDLGSAAGAAQPADGARESTSPTAPVGSEPAASAAPAVPAGSTGTAASTEPVESGAGAVPTSAGSSDGAAMPVEPVPPAVPLVPPAPLPPVPEPVPVRPVPPPEPPPLTHQSP
ncbi:DUF6350 family protein [Streptomyces sp. XM4193]|uniref:cell division protein PerM n=1 Tax=Streptomyces sp. XM4193 TaxID=2929782 RepID=UPI001FFB6825|nr:DUF6350 family protein [Streptomyces sp. XM4193]MCK1795531.1 DUF6350 family protein [Streptomyces sp. XM4193]